MTTGPGDPRLEAVLARHRSILAAQLRDGLADLETALAQALTHLRRCSKARTTILKRRPPPEDVLALADAAARLRGLKHHVKTASSLAAALKAAANRLGADDPDAPTLPFRRGEDA